MNIEKRLELIAKSYVVCGSYCGPNDIVFETECLMELGDTLVVYSQCNVTKKKIENPDQFDPDFMFFLNKVHTDSDGIYHVSYHVDKNI
tara:strand:- start:469 stop:735 length:267 start_codon:yes stop_codon:yes gene_type:complete